MKLGIFACLAGHHEPHRRRVEEIDGELYGRCRYCRTGIMRRGHHDWIAARELESAGGPDARP